MYDCDKWRGFSFCEISEASLIVEMVAKHVIEGDSHDPGSHVPERCKGRNKDYFFRLVIDGKLADCCTGRSVDLNVLRTAGLGQPIG